MRSVVCKSNFRMGYKILSGLLLIPCTVFLRAHVSSVRSIDVLESGRGRVDGLGDAI